jgi:Zn-dependent protease
MKTKVTMRSHIKLAKLFGVEIGLHYSWILIAGLIALSLAGRFQASDPAWGPNLIWAAAILTSLLFFVSLAAHEFAHAMMARAHGIPVRAITLFALGGVAEIEHEPESARTELLIAVIGPLASAAIGLASLALAGALGSASDFGATPAQAVLSWLGYINITLAAFNMIPGFPLDGGRVLHAVLWRVTGNAERSMRIAAQTGRAAAVLFIAYGLFRFMTASGIGGLWLAFIGWFLLEAADSTYTQVRVAEALQGMCVGDIMMRDCPTVDGRTNLKSFIEDDLLRTERHCFIVTEAGREAGLISPAELQGIPRTQWLYKTVSDAMRPLEYTRAVGPQMPLAEALEAMGRENVSQLVVGEHGRLLGVVSRASVLGAAEARTHARG